MRSLSKKVAVFCLLLTVWSAAGLAAHHHTTANDAARCATCVAAHTAAPKAAATLQQATLVFAIVPVAEPVAAQQRFVAFALRVRPPPSV